MQNDHIKIIFAKTPKVCSVESRVWSNTNILSVCVSYDNLTLEVINMQIHIHIERTVNKQR